MIAGLLFATEESIDRPGLLAATLPFGGATLIEYQARLLIAAGAAQIIVGVTRATPELVGAVNRIARRGVSVDVVRSAGEALAKVHPLATIVMLADGLVTSERIITATIAGDGDALLVVDDAHAPPGLERLDATTFWAGIARLAPQRLAEAARMPEEYDLQSTLLRAVAQAHPVCLPLTVAALEDGHGIERDSGRLVQRSRRALASRLAGRRPWIDRFVLAPLTRWLLAPLADRNLPASAPGVAGGILGIGAIALLGVEWLTSGLVVACVAIIVFALGEGLCLLRGDERRAGWQRIAITATAGLATALLGVELSRFTGTATGWLAAASLIVIAGSVERAAPARGRPSWWASPAALMLMVTIATAADAPLAGLIIAVGYAAVSLIAAIERLRA
jgi:hypothetical protein